MINATLRLAISGLVLATGPLASFEYGQAPQAPIQQGGVWEGGRANPSHSGSLTDAPATVAPTSGNNTGASSWSAGRGSFGVQRAIAPSNLDLGNRNGSSAAPSSGASSWTAGRGSFGLNSHQNGIWRSPAGVTRMPGSRSSVNSANKLHNFSGSPGAVASGGMGVPLPRTAATRSPSGTRGSETRPFTSGRPSKTTRGSLSGRAGSKSIPKAPHGRTYQPGRNRMTTGPGQKTSQLGATNQTSFSGATQGTSATPAPQQ